MNKRVFLSYSSHDAAAAMEVCSALEAAGITCWIAPRDIPGGADYGDIIDKAIIGCGAFVVIFSAHSNASQWVRGEVNLAFTENKPIVPYRLDDAPLTGAMRLILNQMHWLDARNDSNCKELAATVKRMLNTAGTTSATNNTNPTAQPTTSTPNMNVVIEHRKGLRISLWILATLIVVGLFGAGFWLSQRSKEVKPKEPSVAVVDSVAVAQTKADSLAQAKADSLAQAEKALEAERQKRKEAERAEKERIRKAKLAEERATRERDSLQRVLQDRERAATERKRIQRELDSLERVRIEQELIAKQTAERLAREKAERQAAEKAERERQERLAREKQEQERLAREKAKREAAEKAKAEEAAHKIYKVGDLYCDKAGRKGIVFRIDATGEHGTIISLEEPANSLEWVVLAEQEAYVAIKASSRSNGASNQQQAMMQSQYASHYPAFVWCMTRKGGEWYMPAIEELELFVNDNSLLSTVNDALKKNGGVPLSNKGYWSSSEVSSRKACSIFLNKNTGNYSSVDGKWTRNSVRAVYRF